MSTPLVAGQLPDDLSFADWAVHVFDHPVTKKAWHWDTDAPFWNCEADPARTVEHLNKLFVDSRELVDRCSADQIGQGLTYLINGSCSNYMHSLLDEMVDLQSRLKCITAINVLFESCFASVCAEQISHTLTRGETSSPANYICYMFWDVAPLFAHSKIRPKKHEGNKDFLMTEAACLSVMERTMRIPHVACQESALHGLGHWHNYYPSEVEKIIDSYLYMPDSKRRGLRQYALSARTGMIQ
jgi:hypothetical protein